MGLVPALEAAKKTKKARLGPVLLGLRAGLLGLVPALEAAKKTKKARLAPVLLGLHAGVWCRLRGLVRRQRRLGWGLCHLGFVPGFGAGYGGWVPAMDCYEEKEG